jgi:hypothetical protein
MTDEAMSSLRRRMTEDMTVRNFAADTQRNYLRAVKNLAIFLGRSPDTATAEDLRLFQLHLTEAHVRPATATRSSSSEAWSGPCVRPTGRRRDRTVSGRGDGRRLRPLAPNVHRLGGGRVVGRRPGAPAAPIALVHDRGYLVEARSTPLAQ